MREFGIVHCVFVDFMPIVLFDICSHGGGLHCWNFHRSVKLWQIGRGELSMTMIVGVVVIVVSVCELHVQV